MRCSHPNFAVFWTWHLVLSPTGNSLTKWNTNAQLQTFPIQRHQNRFGTSTPSWRNRAHVQKRDRQTDRQTKNSTFLATRRRVKSEHHETWHGARGHRARSCTSEAFGGLVHSFAARGR